MTAAAKITSALIERRYSTDIFSDGDPMIIMQIGNEPVSMNRAQSMLNPPQVVAVNTPQVGQLKLRIKADPNTRSFVGRIKKSTDSDFGPTISFASSRDILFAGLTSAVTYVIQLLAIGGTTGQSDWSDPAQGTPK